MFEMKGLYFSKHTLTYNFMSYWLGHEVIEVLLEYDPPSVVIPWIQIYGGNRLRHEFMF